VRGEGGAGMNAPIFRSAAAAPRSAYPKTPPRGQTRIGSLIEVTYTLATEPGASLRAAGLRIVGEVRGRSWSCPSRPRVDTAPAQDKLRWEIAA
jgi:hypothetical protein